MDVLIHVHVDCFSFMSCVCVFCSLHSVLFSLIYTFHFSTLQFIVYACHYMFYFASLSQYGTTAVQCAALNGHKDLVQELCETFMADFLHRNKVRTMQTVSGCEWLSELCMPGFNVGCDLCPFTSCSTTLAGSHVHTLHCNSVHIISVSAVYMILYVLWYSMLSFGSLYVDGDIAGLSS